MKTKGLLFIVLAMLMSISIVSASESGVELSGIDPDEIDFYPVQPKAGMMMNLNYAPAIPACSDAAPSYLKANIAVRLTEKIWFGEVLGTEKLDYLGLLTYFDALLGAVKNDAYRLSPQAGVGNNGMVLAQNAITTLSEGAIVQTTGEYTCLTIHGGTAMFWQVDAEGQIGWLIESIRWENVMLELQSQADNQNAPLQVSPIIQFQLNLNMPPVQFNPLQGQVTIKPITTLSSMEAYYLTPHVYAPTDGTLGGTQLAGNDCAGTAPSRLQIGDSVYFMGHVAPTGYGSVDVYAYYDLIMNGARFNVGNEPIMPWSVGTRWDQNSLIELTDNTDMINELLEEYMKQKYPDADFGDDDDEQPEEAPSLISDDNFLKIPIPLGYRIEDIVSGPLCTRRTIEHNELGYEIDQPYEVQELFVWWQVDLDFFGVELENVWIAESITWYSYKGSVNYYLLTPEAPVNHVPNTYDTPTWIPNDVRPLLANLHTASSCDNILPSTLFSGSLAQPNGNALNLRAVPDGAVVRRIGAEEQVTVYGDSLCWNGYRWWRTDRGGWIAENNHTAALLLPAVQQVAPPVVEETTVAPISTPDLSVPNPTPEPTRPVITEEPTAPPRPTCDVITGANC